DAGEIVGPALSGSFLIAIGVVNLLTFINLFKVFKNPAWTADELASSGGLMYRIARPLMRIVKNERRMYVVGLLFGLGFDTATEVGLLTLSAGFSTAPAWAVLALPLLFGAGMCLMDTSDGLLMGKAYRASFSVPRKQLWYNAVVTGTSVLSAFA